MFLFAGSETATAILALALVPLIQSAICTLGGLIAASGFIVAKKPNAKELLDKLAPFQGIIGVAMVAMGVWGLITVLTNISALTQVPVLMIQVLAMLAVMLAVGFLLAFALLSQWFLSKDETAKAKGEALRAKLVTFQVPLGFAAAGLGVWGIINSL